MAGPENATNQQKMAVVYCGQSSEVNFHGPTVVCQGGISVLAQDNSVMNFTPQRRITGNYDVSGFDLEDTANHTSIEVHSTRACLVADRQSVINMRDLGNYGTIWNDVDETFVVSPDYVTDSGGNNIDLFVSGGSFQFPSCPILS